MSRWLSSPYGVLLFTLALSACQPQSTEPPTFSLVSVTQGRFSQTLELVGDVEAQQQAYLAPLISARLAFLAEDGKRVKAGEMVARLDVQELDENLSDQETELEVARNDLNEQIKTISAEQLRLDANIERARKTLELKRLTLATLEAGTPAQELDKLKLTLAQAAQALKLAEDSQIQREQLLEKGLSTQLEVLQGQVDVAAKRRDHEVAAAELKLKQAGPTPLERQIARLEVKQAENTLTMEQTTKTQQLALLAQQKQKRETLVKSRQKQVEQLKAQIASATFRAPQAGTVLISRIPTEKGLTLAKVGDEMREGTAFMSVADLDTVKIKAEVEEQYIGELKPGLVCTITVPGVRGKKWTGKITEIGVLARERKGKALVEGNRKVFEVELMPDVQDRSLKPGSSVDIQLSLDVRDKVLLLPRNTLQRRGNRVEVVKADGTRLEVKVVAANAKEAVISGAIAIGEQVRAPRTTSTSGGSVPNP
jgi:multidrug efflux pump subunit AcrA (membrane-fusion protein)